MAARAILFDLDGTLVDTRAASWQLFTETNLAFALGIDSRDAFFRAFEGNFFDSLAKMVPDPARAAAVKAHFMELLRTRYHPAVIPGMVDVVRALAPQCTLAVISTNTMEAIRRVLVGAGIATCFSHVFSGDVDARKAVAIRRFLADQRYAVHRHCSPAYRDDGDGGTDAAPFDPRDVVLVTDTVGDIAEAREAGIRAIGVAWGMHGEKQLVDAGAERVALWPQELIAWLRDEQAEAAASCACSMGAAEGSCSASSCATPSSVASCAASSCGVPASSGAALSVPELATHPAIEASRVRRQRQLHSRQAVASPPAALVAAIPASAPAASAELLLAVRRIVAGDRSMTHNRSP